MTSSDRLTPEALLAEDDWLRGLARALVRDPHRVDDVVQQTLVVAWERGQPGGGQPDERPGRGWLSRVLRNFARQDVRAGRRRQAREQAVARERPEHGGPPASDALERLELRQKLLTAVKGLEEPYQTAVALRFLDGLAPREVARRTGVPVKTVHTRVDRGLTKLRARLDDGEGGRGAWLGALTGLAAMGGPGSLWDPAMPGSPAEPVIPGSPAEPVASGTAHATLAGLTTSAKLATAVGAVAVLGVLGWNGVPRLPGPEAPALVAPADASNTPVFSGTDDDSSDRRAELLAPPFDRPTSDDGPGRVGAARVEVGPQALALPTSLGTTPADAASAVLAIEVHGLVGQAEGPLPYAPVPYAPVPYAPVPYAPVPYAPVPYAEVQLDVVDPRTLRALGQAETCRTGPDGRAVARVPAGSTLIARFIGAEGWGRDHPFERTRQVIQPIETGATSAVTLRVRHGRDATFRGRAVDPDGLPVAGVRVERRQTDGPAVHSDSGGLFELSCTSWNQELAQLTHPDHSPVVVALEPTGTGAARDVTLTRSATVVAHLHPESTGGRYLVRVAVEADQLGWPRGLRVRGKPFVWEETLDGPGTARLVGLPAGAQLELDVLRDDGLVLREVLDPTLEPGEERTVHLRIDGSPSLTGVLLGVDGVVLGGRELWVIEALCDDLETRGRLLHGEDVSRLARRVATEPDGSFEVAGLRPGCWWIGPAPDIRPDIRPDMPWTPQSESLAPWAQVLRVPEAGPTPHVELQAQRSRWIEGRVVDDQDRPLDGRVYVQPVGGTGSSASPVGADGTFRVGPVAEGRYFLRPHVHGTLSRTDAVVAEAGDRDVRIVVREGNVIAGSVVDERGVPVDAKVTLVLDGGGSLGIGTGPRGTGKFHFSELEPGRHVLTATAGDLVGIREVVLAEGQAESDLTVALQPGARLSLELVGTRDRLRCALLSEGVIFEDFTLRQGTPALQVVPPGPGLLLLYEGSWADRQVFAEHRFDLHQGQQLELELDVSR